MNNPKPYLPGPAAGARIDKNGEQWTLVIVRELHHPPEKVWQALTDPEQLRAWAPFDVDVSLGATGPVKLSWVGTAQTTEARVTIAEAPKLIEYAGMRWQLEPIPSGTRLTLWHTIDRRFMAMGAAGWHICLDVLELFVGGTPVGRHVGPAMMQFEGWQRLTAAYSRQFGMEPPAG